MHPPKLNFIAPYSRRLSECVELYERLGYSFVEEKHGTGPLHWSSTAPDGLVLELYPATQETEPSFQASVLLGLEVESPVALLQQLDERYIIRSPKPGVDETALIRDPEGRKILLSKRR